MFCNKSRFFLNREEKFCSTTYLEGGPMLIFRLLTVSPIWMTAFVLYIGTIGVLFVLRDKCEGLYYQTSYSAQLGDGGLIVIVLMVAEILKQGASMPTWLQSNWYHAMAIVVAVALGLVWVFRGHPKEWADYYHHLVIAPLLCYFGVTLVPVIYLNGTRGEKESTILLVLFWALLCWYDATAHRLDQRNYHLLGEHLDEMMREG